jgi:hypothetical protein
MQEILMYPVVSFPLPFEISWLMSISKLEVVFIADMEVTCHV